MANSSGRSFATIDLLFSRKSCEPHAAGQAVSTFYTLARLNGQTRQHCLQMQMAVQSAWNTRQSRADYNKLI